MPLNKYELAEDWYNNKLDDNNGDAKQTLLDLLNHGFYTRRDDLDSPQDSQLEQIESENVQFIIKKIMDVVVSANTQIKQNQTDNIDNLDLLNLLSQRLSTKLADYNQVMSTAFRRDCSRSMEGDLYMTNNRVVNLSSPIDDHDLVNKFFAVTKINQFKQNAIPDRTSYFKKDGSVTATGNFNLDGRKITNLADPTNDKDIINKQWCQNYLSGSFQDVDISRLFKRDGSKSFVSYFDLNNHKIRNAKNPTDLHDAVTKQWLENNSEVYMKDKVNTANDLKSISHPIYGEIRYAEDSHRIYVFDETNNSGLVPDDGTSGSWRKAYKDIPLYSTQISSVQIPRNDINFNGTKWLGEDPSSISFDRDPVFHLAKMGDIVTIFFEEVLHIEDANGGIRWQNPSRITFHTDMIGRINSVFNTNYYNSLMMDKKGFIVASHTNGRYFLPLTHCPDFDFDEPLGFQVTPNTFSAEETSNDSIVLNRKPNVVWSMFYMAKMIDGSE